MYVKKKSLIICLIISILVLVALFTFITYKFLNNKEDEQKKERNITVSEIKDYNYSLKYNDNENYKKYFNQLNKELTKDSIDYKNYAELLSKLFIIDFFTLSNKKSNTDIGGQEFINEKIKKDFLTKAKMTIYAIVGNSDISNLPTVKDVRVTRIDITDNLYNEKKYENVYNVYLKWEYERVNDYQNEAIIKIVKENSKLYIMEMMNYE